MKIQTDYLFQCYVVTYELCLDTVTYARIHHLPGQNSYQGSTKLTSTPICLFSCNRLEVYMGLLMLGFPPFPCNSRTPPLGSTSLPAVSLSAQTGTVTGWEQSRSLKSKRQTKYMLWQSNISRKWALTLGKNIPFWKLAQHSSVLYKLLFCLLTDVLIIIYINQWV